MPDTRFGTITRLTGYRFGDDGSIWSARRPDGTIDEIRWKRVKTYRRPYGARYVMVSFRPERNGKLCTFYVHRLILEAFIGPCPDGLEGCHGPDTDTSNNRLDNLRWDTHQSNIDDTEHDGTRPHGSQKTLAKLTESDIPEIRRLHAEGWSQSRIAEQYNMQQTTISAICRRKRWKHVL